MQEIVSYSSINDVEKYNYSGYLTSLKVKRWGKTKIVFLNLFLGFYHFLQKVDDSGLLLSEDYGSW